MEEQEREQEGENPVVQFFRLLGEDKLGIVCEEDLAISRRVFRVVAFPDRDFVFNYEDGRKQPEGSAIGRGKMGCAARAVSVDALTADLMLSLVGGLAWDTATVLAELPRLGVSLMTREEAEKSRG